MSVTGTEVELNCQFMNVFKESEYIQVHLRNCLATFMEYIPVSAEAVTKLNLQ